VNLISYLTNITSDKKVIIIFIILYRYFPILENTLLICKRKKRARINKLIITLYWARNSCSILLRRRSSHESSKAVKSGSLDESAIRDDEVSARYAFIRDCECRRESCSLDMTHSSHPHLQ